MCLVGIIIKMQIKRKMDYTSRVGTATVGFWFFSSLNRSTPFQPQGLKKAVEFGR